MRISMNQLFWIVATSDVAMALWLAISSSMQAAGQDAWLCVILGTFGGTALTLFVAYFSLLHPQKSFVETQRFLLGKWMGTILVFPYLLTWYSLCTILLRREGIFVHEFLLNRTPVWLLCLLIAAPVVYLASGGISSIGRFSELVGPVFYFSVLISLLLSIVNANWRFLLPVLADSMWTKLLQGTTHIWRFTGDALFLPAVVAFLPKPKKLPYRAAGAAMTAGFIILAATVMTIAVLGPYQGIRLTNPLFMVVRSVDIMDFIQNIDILLIFIMTFVIIMKLALFVFITSHEFAKTLGLKQWRNVLWFEGPLIYAGALTIPNFPIMPHLFLNYWAYIVTPICGIVIPLVLWMVTLAKRKSKKG